MAEYVTVRHPEVGLARVTRGALRHMSSDWKEVEVDDSLGANPSRDALGAATATALIAHVELHPEDASRVLEVEQAADKPRSTVIEAASAHAGANDN